MEHNELNWDYDFERIDDLVITISTGDVSWIECSFSDSYDDSLECACVVIQKYIRSALAYNMLIKMLKGRSGDTITPARRRLLAAWGFHSKSSEDKQYRGRKTRSDNFDTPVEIIPSGESNVFKREKISLHLGEKGLRSRTERKSNLVRSSPRSSTTPFVTSPMSISLASSPRNEVPSPAQSPELASCSPRKSKTTHGTSRKRSNSHKTAVTSPSSKDPDPTLGSVSSPLRSPIKLPKHPPTIQKTPVLHFDSTPAMKAKRTHSKPSPRTPKTSRPERSSQKRTPPNPLYSILSSPTINSPHPSDSEFDPTRLLLNQHEQQKSDETLKPKQDIHAQSSRDKDRVHTSLLRSNPKNKKNSFSPEEESRLSI
eukprot:TRINITY_DN25225_c0_g1_i1.p1 TRINITY_DN25225_c0_g1~~TRINITY_DN25225_c0_g1_i1.p1  ORF type:complete len:370 (-),score=37.34 TRINITY_DN25225_c0_g1_i1:10-1119(-)